MAALPPIPDGSPFAVPVLVIMFVLLGALATGWLLLLHAWLDKRVNRQSAHGLRPGGGGEASRTLAPTEPAGQLPQVDRDLWQAAEAAPIRRPRPGIAQLADAESKAPLGRGYAIGYLGFWHDRAAAARPGLPHVSLLAKES